MSDRTKTRRYHLLFEITVTLPEITKERVEIVQLGESRYREGKKRLTRKDGQQIRPRVERNMRLVEALLRPEHSAALQALLQFVVILEISNQLGDSDAAYLTLLEKFGISDNLQEILAPVIRTLSAADQEYFSLSQGEGTFYTSILYCYESIRATVNEIMLCDTTDDDE